MISSVTFETATIADVIGKASKIAPSKGAAFDKAAGIVIEFDPKSTVPLAVVRATNLDLFSIEWVNVTEWSGEAAQWRLPSALVAQVVGSLPIGSGKTVTFTSEATLHSYVVHVKSGRVNAKFYPIDVSYYPDWTSYDPDDMFPATDLGGRISQVEWAASKSDSRLAGVYLDGKWAIATDQFRLACVPLLIPELPRPVVVPAGLLAQTLRQTGDVQIRVTDNMVFVMPDEHTQMKTVVYDVQYPNVQQILDKTFPNELKISRDALVEAMTRINAFSVGDRIASFKVFIGRQELAIYMENEQIGSIGDVIEIPGYADHERFALTFTPKNIIEALQKSPNERITLSYEAGNPKSIVKIDGDSGYRAWVMPRVGSSEANQ